MSGQSIVDRLNAAKHTVTGSALGRAVVKATTEEIIPPKRKHLDYLLNCTSEMNISIPQMADLLIERTQNTSWVVTFKSLTTIHHLMCYGNERFSQYMASHSSKFLLSNFIDKSGVTGIDMSSYIRKYAQYLNEKRETYKLMGFDFCKVKRGKEDGMLRTMHTDKLLKTLPILHAQLEKLLEFDIHQNELTNGVITACFILLSKDLIRLYACYNDGIINLLEKYFDMNKKQCKEALDIYRKFLNKTDAVSGFLKVAETAGMEKGDIPDLTKAPSSLLEALEAHVNSLEIKKSNGSSKSTTAATQQTSSVPSSVTSAINSLNSNTSLSQEEKRRIIEEEARQLDAIKAQNAKKQPSFSNGDDLFSTGQSLNNNNENFFGNNLTQSISTKQNNTNTKPSDDLLFLESAFDTNPFQLSTAPTIPPPTANSFAGGFNVLQPQSATNGTITSNVNLFDSQSIAVPTTTTNLPSKTSFDKLISNDINSSLASLADNLDINHKTNLFNSNKHNWSSTQQQTQTQMKTGGVNWKPMTSTTSPTHQSMMSQPTGVMASSSMMMMMQPSTTMHMNASQPPLMHTVNPMQWPNNGTTSMMQPMSTQSNNPFASIIQPQQQQQQQQQQQFQQQQQQQPSVTTNFNPFF